MPKTIFQEHNSQDRSTLLRSCKPFGSFKAETSFSAIGQDLLQNPTCAHEYNDNKFSILARRRTSFHLSTLEATYIKTPKPIYANKRNSFMVKKSHISFRSFYWSLLLPITIELFPFFLFRQLCLYVSDSLHLFTLFLTDSLKKCQTKSFENK